MKRMLLALLMGMVIVLISNFRASAQASEEAAVRIPLENYLKGHATGDSTYFKRAFHPQAKLFWIRDGKFNERTSAAYISAATGKPADDEAERKRSIASIDISGTSAVAKIVLDYPNALITDYMSLLKVDGEWKIVNKIFHVEPRNR